MVAGIEKRLFEGESEKGKMPKYSLNDFDDELFRAAGEIFAASIAQGGRPPCYMQAGCYDYLVSGKLSSNGVHDYFLTINSNIIVWTLYPQIQYFTLQCFNYLYNAINS